MRSIFSKKNILILTILAGLATTAYILVGKDEFLIENKNLQSIEKDIVDIPVNRLIEDDSGVYHIDSKSRVFFKGNKISRLIFSPSKEKVGFLENRNIFDENIPYNRQVILYVGNVEKKDFKEIFHGSHRTSGWEWFSENEILVSYSCGTECQLLYLANVDSGEENSLIYGVNYEWSPNKELVLAYHYSWNYGITVGDKKGNALLSIERSHVSDENDNLIQKTKARWSFDSEKLALMIKKEKKNEMELLIFDVKNNPKQIYGQDVDYSDEYDLNWSEDGKSIRLNEKEIKIF